MMARGSARNARVTNAERPDSKAVFPFAQRSEHANRIIELSDGRVKWVETCFCFEPLQEERPYWEEFFEFECIKDAHARSRCRDENGAEPWACCDCDCTARLEEWLRKQGTTFKP